MRLELKKNKENLEVNIFESAGGKSIYTNLITKDPKRLAQIFLDIYFLGFPIDKAAHIFIKRLREKDWLSF